MVFRQVSILLKIITFFHSKCVTRLIVSDNWSRTSLMIKKQIWITTALFIVIFKGWWSDNWLFIIIYTCLKQKKWFKGTRHNISRVGWSIFTRYDSYKSLETAKITYTHCNATERSKFKLYRIALYLIKCVNYCKKTYFDDNLVCFYLIASLSVAWICNLKMIQANDLNRIYKIYNCQVNWNAIANICNNPYKVIPRTKLLRRFIVCEHNFLNISILRTVWTKFTVKDTYISKWLKPMWT